MNGGLVAAVCDRRCGWAGFGGHGPPLPVLLTLVLCGAAIAEPAPVLFRTGPGRFEVAAVDVSGAQAVVARADEAWRLLAAPLALPEAFSSPVFVRLVPAAEWTDAAPFRVIVEAGGVVSVRVRWGEVVPELFVRRALVQGLLMRIAVAQRGASERLVAPLWLEQACIGWWQTRAEPAQLDALKQETARLAPPALVELLQWQRGAAEPVRQAQALEPVEGRRDLAVGAVWLLAWLQAESGRAAEWHGLLPKLLAGEPPAVALAASFPGRFANDDERELWWQTGWHQLSRARSLPTLDAAESRATLAELARFVFAANGRDAAMSLRAVLGRAREPLVAAELDRHAGELNRWLPSLHPFYRNAGLSLAEALASRGATGARRDALGAAFERDWRDAVELEAATAAALDALERKPSL